ncbi:basic amino acid ABC transporter substrate-binding protein [Pseudodesulfovibrio tunisiensis]|uniref:basic amino acid ABC transporter substrate-binding protein n=1 Tax=Pseudodesulfovibrio tunisiensis TaxID=463192 RepID=UPI001FB2D889|nr:basic amino acid ABC transporter substrate-binding protein [Pseudodesulfovibrio tunisiensis]
MKRNVFKLVTLLAAATLMVAFVGNAFAGSAWEKIKEKGVMTIGNSPDYPPFEFIGDTGERTGFDIDLMDALSKEMGIEVRWMTMDFAAIVTAVQSGQADIGMSGMSVSEERRQQVDFSDPYVASGQVIVTLPDSPVKSAEDLKGKKIAVQLGTTGEQQADKIEGATVVRPETYNIAFMMLKNKAADAVIADLSVADEYAKQGMFQRAGEPLSLEEFAIITKKGNSDLLEALNNALKAVKASGKYDEIVKKWNL